MLCKEKEKKMFKFKISIFQKSEKSNFVRILETKIQETFEKVQEGFVGGVAFVASIGPMLTKKKKDFENLKILNFERKEKKKVRRYGG